MPKVVESRRVSGVVPSPQSMLTLDMVPSESAAMKVKVTVWPPLAGEGETREMVNVGGRSLISTADLAWPVDPALSVAFTLMLKEWDWESPALAYE